MELMKKYLGTGMSNFEVAELLQLQVMSNGDIETATNEMKSQ